ncbi:hypothetical protein NE865_03796 [Phthorimaea operculella]|nr:hypothetical protein NE865_03796 [Phthorimaea operculella]
MQVIQPDIQSDSEIEEPVPRQQQVIVTQAQVHAPPPPEPRGVVTPVQARAPSTSSTSAIVSRPRASRVVPPAPAAPQPDVHLDEVTQSMPLVNDVPAELPCNDCPAEQELDGDILEILGEDPSKSKIYGKDIQKDLAVRFEHIATNGLTKELRKELKEKYPVPANCKLIDAPQVNPEAKAAISETASKRLGGMEQKQKQLASAISCLGEAITLLISQNNADSNLLKLLMDAARMICDTQYSDSLTRRYFILGSMKKDVKDQLLQTKIDTFLFGSNLAETLKSAKAINKSGAELKQTASFKPTTWKANNKNTFKKSNLNTKTAPSSHRSTGSARPRAPAPKNQPVSSSRRSRQTTKQTRYHR